jgi:chromosomal replication initiation ATPase DnaA
MQGTDSANAKRNAGRADANPVRAGMAQAIVACAYDVPLHEMRAATRRGPRIALARQIAMYLTHVVFRMSLSQVAEAFMRHRSTACHALHHIEDLREDPELDRTLLYLESALRAAMRDAA